MIVRWRFRTKIYLSIVSILLVFGICLGVVITRIVARTLLAESKKRGTASAVTLAARVAEPVLALDFLSMKNLVDELLQSSEDMVYGFVLDQGERPLVHTFRSGFPVDLIKANQADDSQQCRIQLLTDGRQKYLDFAAPVMVAGQRLGTVRIGMSQSKALAGVHNLAWVIALVTGVGIFFSTLLAAGLARTVTRRIALLRHSAQQIVMGNLNIVTAPHPKKMCWELMECDRKECPAYGDEGLRCWYLAGTLCPSCVEGEYAKKIESCRHCTVFRRNSGDELQDLAEYFDFMARTLGDRVERLKNTEQHLSRQHQVFRTILDVTPDIVCLQDRESRYLAVSRSFCRFFHKEERDILDRTDFDLFPADVAQANHEEDLRVVAKRAPLQLEKRIDGAREARWFHLVKTPVLDEMGNVIGILCNARDITDLKELQARMAQAQKLESIGQLAAGIAHEINTPLAIMLGYVQLLLEDFPPDSEIYEDLKLMEKQCRVCKRIVADLLRFSRHTESVKRPLDLNKTLEQVLSVVEHAFALDHIHLVRDLSARLPLVYGDQEKLEQVFMNLLTNAHQAIGCHGRITVRTQAQEDQVVVAIEDTGSGIPPDIRSRIFDPFFTTKGVGEGTGLGLSVTFGIVKDHGGSIEFTSRHVSEVGEREEERDFSSSRSSGTTFICRFPAWKG